MLRAIVERQKAGEPRGIYSLCSAHPLVIYAALSEAAASDEPVLIEATCNQVNQFGGYTGMRPADFRSFVLDLAAEAGVPEHRLLLGGDHLGPSPWESEPAERALAKAAALVDEYVRAGFRKIHLDCSMACADDPPVLPDELIARRAAELCRVAERAWEASGGEAPSYVVGTEVPTPGGALEDLGTLHVTRPENVLATLESHETAFRSAGVGAAWERVVALVVQPGVEFDHESVVDYEPSRARSLANAIESVPNLVYEAHSTDYQTPLHLAQLVRDHFAILKVGPAATFALREAYWALAEIEMALVPADRRSNMKSVVLAAMHAEPSHWNRHYRDEERRSLLLEFSFSDRIRYYWQVPAVRDATAKLVTNLEHTGIPLSLLSQYLPLAYQALREGRLPSRRSDRDRSGADIESLVIASVADVLRPYRAACNGGFFRTKP